MKNLLFVALLAIVGTGVYADDKTDTVALGRVSAMADPSEDTELARWCRRGCGWGGGWRGGCGWYGGYASYHYYSPGYAYSYYPSYYYPSYYYTPAPVYYYTPPVTTYYYYAPISGQSAPTVPLGQTVSNSSATRSYKYDGGPIAPVTQPSQVLPQPRKTEPAAEEAGLIRVSIPANPAKPALKYPAYGEKR